MIQSFTSILTLLCLATGGLVAQSHPLPQTHKESFLGSSPWAGEMFLPSSVERLRMTMEFTNSIGSSVTLEWTYYDSHTTQGVKRLTEETSYRPTAVCKRAGLSDTIYVAGWIEPLGAVVVEEWVLENYRVLVPPITEGYVEGESPKGNASLVLPRIRKTVVFQCDAVGPISSLACSITGNDLWLLSESAPDHKVIYTLDLDSPDARCSAVAPLVAGTPAVTLSVDPSNPEGSYAPLAPQNTLRAMEHPEAGFVIYAEPARAWANRAYLEEPYELIVFWDADKDGYHETIQQRTYESFYTEFPLAEFDRKYD